MTFDMVALCRDQPGPAAMIGAMLTAGPELRMDTVEPAKLIQLYDPVDRRLLLTIEGPRLVQVPGEVHRLLGVESDEVPHPVWWVESRAPARYPKAEEAARRFTAELVRITGGVSWSSR